MLMHERYKDAPRYLATCIDESWENGVVKGRTYTVSRDADGQHEYVFVHNPEQYGGHIGGRHVMRYRFGAELTPMINDSPMPPQDKIPDLGMKYDDGKLLFRPLMNGLALSLRAVAAVLSYGKQKYAEDSWQTVPNARERYENAMYRHLNDRSAGETYDKESGLPHLAHVICNAMFVLWLEIKEKIVINIDKFNPPPTR